MAQVFSVSMNKGGVGKTSLLTNVVAVLSRKHNRKVLIIDMDAQGNSSMAFGLNPATFKDTMYDALVGKKRMKDIIVRVSDNLDIAPSNEDMNFLDFDILPKIVDYPEPFKLLKSHVDEVRADYDYIFIDTPPSLSLVAANVFTCADHVIIPFVPEMFGVKGLIRIIKSIDDFRIRDNPALRIAGIVPTMVDTRTTLHTEMMQEAQKYCYEKNIKIFDTVIPKSIRFAAATAYKGEPAVWSDASNSIVSAYYELTQEVIDYGKGQ